MTTATESPSEAITDGAADEARIKAMFEAGAHFGYTRTRRHPSVKPYIFGTKDTVEIFDLEKTAVLLAQAKEYVHDLAASGKMLLFVSSKEEAQVPIRNAATRVGQPFVAGRWIGGTITNYPEIKKRLERLETLRTGRERGEHAKYTKRERLMIDREIAKLEEMYGGLSPMRERLPDALFVIDPKHEEIAVKEALHAGIPIVALGSSDMNVKNITRPVIGNDGNIASIRFFVGEIAEAYENGLKNKKPEKSEEQGEETSKKKETASEEENVTA